MPGSKAFIFDVSGTMMDDLSVQQQLWTEILAQRNLIDAEGAFDLLDLYGTNREFLQRTIQTRLGEDQLEELSLEKERRYLNEHLPFLAPLPGLSTFIAECCALHVPIAIASETLPSTAGAILKKSGLDEHFKILVLDGDVTRSKPDPTSHLLAAERMGFSPSACIAFEDHPKGVEAALEAGMQAVVVTTRFDHEAFDSFPNILLYVNDYSAILPETFIGRRKIF